MLVVAAVEFGKIQEELLELVVMVVEETRTLPELQETQEQLTLVAVVEVVLDSHQMEHQVEMVVQV
tara:strand:+ start:305 stop:502 length:198 start_codon:yes stop_codon:yes gene_type:complete